MRIVFEQYIVTGADGFVGNAVVRALAARGCIARVFTLPGGRSDALEGVRVSVVEGDLRRPEQLDALFQGLGAPMENVAVIHAAGLVSIGSGARKRLTEVNVRGTRNIVEACRKYRIGRLVYVSSVHAIPEPPHGTVIRETETFDPKAVKGLYAKSKAEATALVLRAARAGLDAVVVHPSGIVGPGDFGRGNFTQLIRDYMGNRLWAYIRGGYDFVDVRDVAEGILRAAERGRRGECYILSGAYRSVKELLDALSRVTGKKPIRLCLPQAFAKGTAPLAELYYRLLGRPPLYTPYSVRTLGTNAAFSHGKAAAELGYAPRELTRTLEDTVRWLEDHNGWKTPSLRRLRLRPAQKAR